MDNSYKISLVVDTNLGTKPRNTGGNGIQTGIEEQDTAVIKRVIQTKKGSIPLNRVVHTRGTESTTHVYTDQYNTLKLFRSIQHIEIVLVDHGHPDSSPEG